MDKQKCRQIGEDAQRLLEALAAKYDCTVTARGGSFDGHAATLKFEFAETSDEGVLLTREAQDFTHFAHRHDLDPEDLGKEFVSGTDRYTIVGLRKRATKHPILCRRQSDGKTYAYAAATVKQLLTLKANVEAS